MPKQSRQIKHAKTLSANLRIHARFFCGIQIIAMQIFSWRFNRVDEKYRGKFIVDTPDRFSRPVRRFRHAGRRCLTSLTKKSSRSFPAKTIGGEAVKTAAVVDAVIKETCPELGAFGLPD